MPYKIRFHTIGRDGLNPTGHMFVELDDGQGTQTIRGFYPKDEDHYKSGTLQPVPGYLNDDDLLLQRNKGVKSSEWKTITKQGYDNAMKEIHDIEDGKGAFKFYDLNERNCFDFGNRMVQASGLKGDIDDHLTKAQRGQATIGAVYNYFKYRTDKPGNDRRLRETREAGSGVEGEIGGWPGEERASGKIAETVTSETASPLSVKTSDNGAVDPDRVPDWMPRQALDHPVMKKLAHARTLAPEVVKAKTERPPSVSYGLAEALHGKPFEKVVKTQDGDIPLDNPALLHKKDVRALMESKPYRDAKHPLSRDTQKTVKTWFDKAYPGKAGRDASGRPVSASPVDRPENAPKSLKSRSHSPMRAAAARPAPAPRPVLSGPSNADAEASRRAARLARAKAVQKGIDAHFARVEKQNAKLRHAKAVRGGVGSGPVTASTPVSPAPPPVAPAMPVSAPKPIAPPQPLIKAPPPSVPLPSIAGPSISARSSAPSFGGAFSFGGVNGAGSMAAQVPAAPAGASAPTLPTSSASAASAAAEPSSAAAARVICTELTSCKLMAPELYFLDLEFTERHLSPITVRGYHVWAVPYVRLMRRSDGWGRLAVRIARPLALWRAEEVAHRLGRRAAGNWKGKLVRWTGEPLCTLIGFVAPEIDPFVLYQ